MSRFEGWSPSRLKYIAGCNLAALPENTEDDQEFTYIDIGNVTQGSADISSPPIRFGDAPSRARRLAEPGDTVVSTVRTYLRAVATVPASDSQLVFSTGFAVLHPSDEVFPRYLSWYLQGDEFVSRIEANSTGVSYPAIASTQLISLGLRLPPLPEQKSIADFLDRETAQIDTLIEEQQRLIEMLRERRVAVVDRVTWRGLDPSVDLSATGIDTAPVAPTHWLRRRNRHVYDESSETSETGTEELLSVSHLTGITTRAEKQVNMIEAESLVGYRAVKPNDLVINTMWAWMGALGVSTMEGVVSPAYGVYRPLPDIEIEPAYFDYIYRSRPYVIEMTRHSRGIWESRLRLYPDVFLRLPIVVPPLAEQLRIVSYLDEQTAKIDALIAETERFIELSRERRSALITAAVTGQVDVRTSPTGEQVA